LYDRRVSAAAFATSIPAAASSLIGKPRELAWPAAGVRPQRRGTIKSLPASSNAIKETQ
jgi:hypothetical protein